MRGIFMTKVLLVEDTMTEATIIIHTLQSAGIETVQVKSSEEAKERLSEVNPDLVLLDVVLPGESGFGFCRDLTETSDIPVIICSTKDSEMDKFWGMKQGAVAYLTKPINSEELVKTVRLHTKA